MHGSGCSPLHDSSSLPVKQPHLCITLSRKYKAQKHHSRLQLENNSFWECWNDPVSPVFSCLGSHKSSLFLTFVFIYCSFSQKTEICLNSCPSVNCFTRYFFSLFPLYVLLLVTPHRRVLRCVSEHALLFFFSFSLFGTPSRQLRLTNHQCMRIINIWLHLLRNHDPFFKLEIKIKCQSKTS